MRVDGSCSSRETRGMEQLGGALTGRGGRRRRSDGVWRGGGAPVAESWRGGRLGGGESVCGTQAWTGETNDARGRRKSVDDRWLLFKGRWGTAERGGGPAVEMPCTAGAAWGLAPSGGQHPDRVPPAARAGGAPLFRQWCTDAADVRAPAVGGRGSEKREAWACVGRAQMNNNI
jgi:hypothetical protein